MNDLIEMYVTNFDEKGHRKFVLGGLLPSKEVVTGTGDLEVLQLRVRCHHSIGSNRQQLNSAKLLVDNLKGHSNTLDSRYHNELQQIRFGTFLVRVFVSS